MGVEFVLLFVLSLSAGEAGEILEKDIAELKETIEKILVELAEIVTIFDQQNIDVEQVRAERTELKDEKKNTDSSDLQLFNNVSNRLEVVRMEYNKTLWKFYGTEIIKNEIEKKLEILQTELELKENTLEKLKKISLTSVRYQNVGIELSGVCISMIKHSIPNNCPTYYELYGVFDNTNPLVSGNMILTTNDIKRDAPQLQNHWKWYVNHPTIIMVDPDTEFKNRNITIVIQARDFYSFEIYEGRKNFWDGERTITYSNVKFSNDCKTILVSPNMELITRVLNYAATGCEGEFDIEPNVKTFPKIVKESRYVVYEEQVAKVREQYANSNYIFFDSVKPVEKGNASGSTVFQEQ